MTIQSTRWSPDTCTCVIEYEWDDTVAQSSRVHTPVRYPVKCPAHTILATDTDRWTCLLEENPRKNIALENTLTNGPSTMYDMNGTVRQLKPTITYNFSWSGTAPNRVLTISFTGITLTTTQKNTIQSALNTRFGSGKVLIV